GGVDVLRIAASTLPPGDLYRPFTVLTFALNERIAPANAAAYHAVNIVLHAMVTLLVFWLMRRLVDSLQIAIVAAALFALHPIHTEAVTSLVGRAELLATLFGLTAVLTAERSDAARNTVSRRCLQATSLAAFSLALFSKESALALVVLVPLFRVACRRQRLV